MDCSICAETFNNSTKATITCPYSNCLGTACKNCVRTYILSKTSDPHCMFCKQTFTFNFMSQNLNRSWMETDFKNHRAKMIMETQMSLMPTSMEAAERYKKVESHEKEVLKLKENITTIRGQLNRVERAKWHLEVEIRNLKLGKTNTPKQEFIRPCGNENCRGFLSTSYKCAQCDLYTCPDCFEIIGYSKTDEHTCKKENVETAAMIKKECKQCPGKCGANIFKIDGCSQMYCTNCHIAFDWNTLAIETGTIHNPHYYQVQAQLNGAGPIARAPGDVLCGGLPGYQIFRARVLNKLSSATTNSGSSSITGLAPSITNMHRFVGHITNVNLYNTRQKVEGLANNEDIRIKYLLHQIEKKDLGILGVRKDTQRRKYNEFLHLYELLSVSGIEIFATLVNSELSDKDFINEVSGFIKQYTELCKYCNKEFQTISLTFNLTVPFISPSFKISSTKYNLKKA